MKQIARLISFDDLHKLPEGTEFTACFTDTVKRDLPPVILKKRDARNWAERALDGIQILGTDRDGAPHAILKGTAVFSLSLTAVAAAEEQEPQPAGFPSSGPWQKLANALGAPSAKTVMGLEERAGRLLNLLQSAKCIADRGGRDTNWPAFADNLRLEGFTGVTARTYRVLSPTPSGPAGHPGERTGDQ